MRTYLVPFIRRLQVLDEEFERPVDAVALCRAHRSTTRVLIVVPRDREWVVELLAERVSEQRRDEDVLLAADLLEPRRQRVGLLLVQAGPDAFVLEPPDLRDAGGTTPAPCSPITGSWSRRRRRLTPTRDRSSRPRQRVVRQPLVARTGSPDAATREYRSGSHSGPA